MTGAPDQAFVKFASVVSAVERWLSGAGRSNEPFVVASGYRL
jgi:hypothetical protein